MKRLSPRVFALSLAFALFAATPASAATPINAHGDPTAPIPDSANASEEISEGGGFQPLSSGPISVTWGGHGHGIGMPQWGAKTMADNGSTYQQILQHFYTGAQIGKTDLYGGSIKQHADPLVVALATSQAEVRFQAQGGPVTICFGDPNKCSDTFTANPGETWYAVRKYNAYCVVEKDVSGQRVELASMDCSDPAPDSHGTQFVTLRWDNQPNVKVYVPSIPDSNRRTYARGYLSIITAAGQNMHVRARLGMEEYLYGLGEVPVDWPEHTLKAQAVAAQLRPLQDLGV